MELTITIEQYLKRHEDELPQIYQQMDYFLAAHNWVICDKHSYELDAMIDNDACFVLVEDCLRPPTGYPTYLIYNNGQVRFPKRYEFDYAFSVHNPEKVMGHTPHGGCWTLKWNTHNGETFMEKEYGRYGNLICTTTFAEFEE